MDLLKRRRRAWRPIHQRRTTPPRAIVHANQADMAYVASVVNPPAPDAGIELVAEHVGQAPAHPEVPEAVAAAVLIGKIRKSTNKLPRK